MQRTARREGAYSNRVDRRVTSPRGWGHRCRHRAAGRRVLEVLSQLASHLVISSHQAPPNSKQMVSGRSAIKTCEMAFGRGRILILILVPIPSYPVFSPSLISQLSADKPIRIPACPGRCLSHFTFWQMIVFIALAWPRDSSVFRDDELW